MPGAALAMTVALLAAPTAQGEAVQGAARIIRAAIEMERIEGTGRRGMAGPATFIPEGADFSVVFSRGLVHRNATEYHLRRFTRDSATRRFAASSVLRLTSSSNHPAIASVKWLPGGRTVAFLGARGDSTPQVYTFDRRTRELSRRSSHPAPILDYDVSDDGGTLVYLAREPVDLRARDRQRQLGVVARDGEPGSRFDSDDLLTPNVAVVLQRRGDARGRVVSVLAAYDSVIYAGLVHSIRLSRDGRYAVFAWYVPPSVPEQWRTADNEATREFILTREKAPPTYGLVDLATGAMRPLMDAPASMRGAGITWAHSGSRVAVGGYLPLGAGDSVARRVAGSDGALVEVEVPSGRTTLIKEGLWEVIRWSPSADTMTIADNQAGVRGDTTTTYVTVARRGGRWVPLDSIEVPLPSIFPRHGLVGRLSLSPDLVVGVAESLSRPPDLGVYEITTGQSQVVTRLNQALEVLPRGRIEEVSWPTPQGVTWQAHLVTPHGYVPGRRYPAVLMIMDMSFCDRYVLDGRFYRASYPVQAMASAGVAVLMVYFPHEFFEKYVTPDERPIILGGVEGGVRYLVDRGIADSASIGITGFSHAGYVVEYAMQHATTRFAAAVAIDNWDASYLGYALLTYPGEWISHERFYGGTPYGPAREAWFRHAVGFNPARVRTPLLLETHNPYYTGDTGASRFWSWEVFGGLKRFGKPVELVRYTYGDHTMVKPLEQLSAATRQVDWLRYWLQDYEDPAPGKAAQYARWRRLRSQQVRNQPPVPLPAADRSEEGTDHGMLAR